ncbi:MAG: ATPase [Schaedlerella sp.]|nr:ATPase [Schaedlerella sp.]
MVYERNKKEYERLENRIGKLRQKISTYPEGKFTCAKNGKNYRWYRSFGASREAIPKANRVLAEVLAEKNYMQAELKDLEQEKKALGFYLNHHNIGESEVEKLFRKSPEYQNLLKAYFKPKLKILEEWEEAFYETNKNYPEQLIHKTSSGRVVRSKAEAMIDMFLYKNKIPFRYECKLQLGELILYPDFTIRHPQTGKIFYWEHFGLMDYPEYVEKTYSKLQIYAQHGIIESINLITTFETKNNPLSTEMIEKIIDYYFLT